MKKSSGSSDGSSAEAGWIVEAGKSDLRRKGEGECMGESVTVPWKVRGLGGVLVKRDGQD